MSQMSNDQLNTSQIKLQVLDKEDVNSGLTSPEFFKNHLHFSTLENLLCVQCNKILNKKNKSEVLDKKVRFLKLSEIFDKEKS